MPWLMFNDAFLSIVADNDRPHLLVVRARAKGDIERVFPQAKVRCLEARDYAFRAYVPRSVVAAAVSERLLNTAETNFKDSVKEKDRHDYYARVWGVMADFQAHRGHGRPYQTTRTGKGRPPYRGAAYRPVQPGRAYGYMRSDLFESIARDTADDLFADPDFEVSEPVSLHRMTDEAFRRFELEDEFPLPDDPPRQRRRRNR